MSTVEAIPLILAGVLGGLVVAAVVAAFNYRRSASRASTDLDDIAVEVERLGKAFRRLTMQRVRGAAPGLEEPLPTVQSLQPAVPRPMTKDELRQRVFGGKP